MIAKLIRQYLGSIRLFAFLLITWLFWTRAPLDGVTISAYFANALAWLISEHTRKAGNGENGTP